MINLTNEQKEKTMINLTNEQKEKTMINLTNEQKEKTMINLTESTRAKDLTEMYFDNKMRIDALTEQNKEILETLVSLSGEQPAKIGTRKLTHTVRAGSVSYATIVKEHMPKLDLEPYRGAPTNFWKLS